MAIVDPSWSLFTKPWRETPVSQLGPLVRSLGFDAVELPVRPGYQVTPRDVRKGLARAVGQLGSDGIRVASIASGTDEATFAACADAAVPAIRIMVPVSPRGYSVTGGEIRARLDVLAGRAEYYGVRVGIQPHYDDYISDSTGLHALLRDYDPAGIGAIWDIAHDALARKHPEHGLELLWPWLMIVNLKSAYFRRAGILAGTGDPVWEPEFVGAREGMAQWGRAIGYLVGQGYAGPICLTAEYSDERGLTEKVGRDLRYAKALWDAAQRDRSMAL